VTKILLECAEKEPGLAPYDQPEVWLAALGDSSIEFELLVWSDIRRFSQKEIRSRLNFQIFEALRDAGIESPRPQREILLRSTLDLPVPSTQLDDGTGDVAA